MPCFLTLINPSFFRQFHGNHDSLFFFWFTSFSMRFVTHLNFSDKVLFEQYKRAGFNRSLRWELSLFSFLVVAAKFCNPGSLGSLDPNTETRQGE